MTKKASKPSKKKPNKTSDVEKNLGGRPTAFTDEIGLEICKRIGEGESLNRICLDGHMPVRATVYNWLYDEKRKKFLDMYENARERQADTFVDQCADIADFTAKDTIVKTTKKGDEYEAIDHEWVQRSRLRVDTRKWMAEKLAPRKYGKRQEIAINPTKQVPTISKDITEEEALEAYRDVMG